MKTRILTSTLVLLLAVAATAFATESVKNDSAASRHENTATQQFTLENYGIYAEESVMMESWIDNLNSWEQEGQATETGTWNVAVNMEDWMSTRDNWEQDTEPVKSNDNRVQTSLLNEWIASAENWEQR